MNKGLTVSQLYDFCEKQIRKGNGAKHIQITTDDEGNGYHTLFYAFLDDVDEIQACKNIGMFHDDINANEVVLLG